MGDRRRGIGAGSARHPSTGWTGVRFLGYHRRHQRWPTAVRFKVSSSHDHRAQASKVSPRRVLQPKGRPSVFAFFLSLSTGLLLQPEHEERTYDDCRRVDGG
jgi:hypothetical protein